MATVPSQQHVDEQAARETQNRWSIVMISMSAPPDTLRRFALPGLLSGGIRKRQPGTLAERYGLSELMAGFDAVTLAQASGVAFRDRSEVKYVMPGMVLPAALGELRRDYDALVVENTALCRYRTLYFDTSGYALYQRHHAGALNTYKVRAREYVDSCCAFLEVKQKTNRHRTIKQRVQTAGVVTALTGDTAAFVGSLCPYPVQDLRACLWNRYTRITLLSRGRAERVTIDVDVDYLWRGDRVSLPGLVIAEVKQERGSPPSPFMRAMRAHHVRSTGFSKFCIGLSLLYPGTKHNNFKAKLRLVARMMDGGIDALA